MMATDANFRDKISANNRKESPDLAENFLSPSKFGKGVAVA